MIASLADLLSAHSRPTTAPLAPERAARLLALLPDWALEDGQLVRRYPFKNYYRTMAFVNAVAYLSHNEDHHPEMTVNYNHCVLRYTTHSAHGLSDNDFICAAKADALYQQAGA
ncbi:4a-hydroxytetrahydrobiopterin dehydratase [Duganella callida]|uniref:Putative pterin-4-alpha-carbinolamine dehydratase n=1 Tax=Duganella callida TaxID=2561932 RepID=A0A4Y9S4H8_9BURK|nr:4a-hydroxytetrahydrobiopterin dehydratase [Duganella callida]TFW16252.1 4a-hydroxytetrahydrobiopterin dehydratase [Duganella callida]